MFSDHSEDKRRLAKIRFERIIDSFISQPLREEMLRQFYFIIQLPVDEGGRSHSIVTLLCLMYHTWQGDINEMSAQVAGSQRAPSLPSVTGSKPRPNVHQHGKVLYGTSKHHHSSLFSPICKEPHPSLSFFKLKLIQLSDLFDSQFSLWPLSIHLTRMSCCLYGVAQVGIAWLISCDNWFTYCDKTLATVATDCRRWAPHFYSQAAEKTPSALHVAQTASLLPLKCKSSLKKKKNMLQIALSISHGEPPYIPQLFPQLSGG